MPNSFTGVLKGVSAVFFAYIGFDAISTTAEECANPQRDLPRGMIYSLIICTVIYVVVTLVITGMVNYSEFDQWPIRWHMYLRKSTSESWILCFSQRRGCSYECVAGISDRSTPNMDEHESRWLMPKRFGKIHPKFHTPGFATVVTGIIVAIPALFIESG